MNPQNFLKILYNLYLKSLNIFDQIKF